MNQPPRPPTVVVVGSGFHAISTIFRLQAFGESGTDEVSIIWISSDRLRLVGSPFDTFINEDVDGAGGCKAVTMPAKGTKLHTSAHYVCNHIQSIAKEFIVLSTGQTVRFDALLLALDPSIDTVPPATTAISDVTAPPEEDDSADAATAALMATNQPPLTTVLNMCSDVDTTEILVPIIQECTSIEYSYIPGKEDMDAQRRMSERRQSSLVADGSEALKPLADGESRLLDDSEEFPDSDDEPDADDVIVELRPTYFSLHLPPAPSTAFASYVESCLTANATIHWDLAFVLRFPALTSVHLDGVDLGDDGAIRFLNVCHENSTFRAVCASKDDEKGTTPTTSPTTNSCHFSFMNMEAFTMSNCGLTEAAIEPLVTTLFYDAKNDVPVRSTLKKLNLSGNKQIGEGVQKLLSGLLKTKCELQSLNIAGTGMSHTAVPTLCQLLASTPSLTALNCSDNAETFVEQQPQQQQQPQTDVQRTKEKTSTTNDEDENLKNAENANKDDASQDEERNVKDEPQQPAVPATQEPPIATSSATTAILHSCRHHVEEVHLANTAMDDSAAPKLRALLESSSACPSKLKVLNIGRNTTISDEIALSIGDGLMKSTVQSLTELHLNGCADISVMGVEFMFKCAAAIGGDACLVRMDTRGTTPLGVNQIPSVAAAMESCEKLRTVELSIDEREQLCVTALREALKTSNVTELQTEFVKKNTNTNTNTDESTKDETIPNVMSPVSPVDEQVLIDIQNLLVKNAKKVCAASPNKCKKEDLGCQGVLDVAMKLSSLVAAVGKEKAFAAIVDPQAAALLPKQHHNEYRESFEKLLSTTSSTTNTTTAFPPSSDNVDLQIAMFGKFDAAPDPDYLLQFSSPYIPFVRHLTGFNNKIPVQDNFMVRRVDQPSTQSPPVFAFGSGVAHDKLPNLTAADMSPSVLGSVVFTSHVVVNQILSHINVDRRNGLQPCEFEPLSADWLFSACASHDFAQIHHALLWQPPASATAHHQQQPTQAQYLQYYRVGNVIEKVFESLNVYRPSKFVDRSLMDVETIKATLEQREEQEKEDAVAKEKEKDHQRAKAADAGKKSAGGKGGGAKGKPGKDDAKLQSGVDASQQLKGSTNDLTAADTSVADGGPIGFDGGVDGMDQLPEYTDDALTHMIDVLRGVKGQPEFTTFSTHVGVAK